MLRIGATSLLWFSLVVRTLHVRWSSFSVSLQTNNLPVVQRFVVAALKYLPAKDESRLSPKQVESNARAIFDDPAPDPSSTATEPDGVSDQDDEVGEGEDEVKGEDDIEGEAAGVEKGEGEGDGEVEGDGEGEFEGEEDITGEHSVKAGVADDSGDDDKTSSRALEPQEAPSSPVGMIVDDDGTILALNLAFLTLINALKAGGRRPVVSRSQQSA